MTDTQVTLLLAHIKEVKDAVMHSQVVMSSRLSVLEGQYVELARRVREREMRDEHEDDTAASEADRETRRGGWVIGFLSGASVAVIGQIVAAVLDHY